MIWFFCVITRKEVPLSSFNLVNGMNSQPVDLDNSNIIS